MAEELVAQFAAMTDRQMREVGHQYASLNDEAKGLVRAEFKRRGLETPTEQGQPGADVLAKVMTIRQYRDQTEAIMARSVLESAGIGCYLRDENTIRIDWLWSNLMGGIRLQVMAEDVEAAEAVLSQPIPESIAVSGEPDYQQPKCPKCGSLDTSFNDLKAKVGATSMLILGFPLPSPVETNCWRCHDCGCSWSDESDSFTEDYEMR